MITQLHHGAATVLQCAGEFDAEWSAEMTSTCAGLWRDGRVYVVVDLDDMSAAHFDVHHVKALLELDKIFRMRGGRLVVATYNLCISQHFQMVRLQQMVYGNSCEAISDLRALAMVRGNKAERELVEV